jgi:hypothetical protein
MPRWGSKRHNHPVPFKRGQGKKLPGFVTVKYYYGSIGRPQVIRTDGLDKLPGEQLEGVPHAIPATVRRGKRAAGTEMVFARGDASARAVASR